MCRGFLAGPVGRLWARSAAAAALLVVASAATVQAAQEVGEDDKLAISADVRFRLEDTLEAGERPGRFRGRLRYRLEAIYDVTPSLRVGGRVTSGDPEDPNSPYQDLGEMFERFPLSVDRLFLSWMPVRQLQVTAGKFAHPFLSNPIYGELLWDADVQPEGLVLRYLGRPPGGAAFGAVAVGQYILLEQSRSSNSYATVAQAGGNLTVTDGLVVRGAVGYYGYRDLAPDGAIDVLLKNRGNAVLDSDGDGEPDAFASEFVVLDTMFHLRFTATPRPLQIGGQYWHNFGAEIDKDTGWPLGGSYGALGAKGDWRLYCQFQRVEQDSLFSPFVQDDFVHATDYDGHVIGAAHRVLPRADLNLWALGSRRLRAGEDDANPRVWRLRADMTFVF